MDNLPPPSWELLTEREQEVALALGRGLSCREIAGALNLSIKTVDTHRGHTLKKLRCSNAVQLALFLVREGRVTP